MPFFSTFLRLQGDHHCACAQQWRHLSFFPRAFKQKKIKALRPKMTKIASRGSCLKATATIGGRLRRSLQKFPPHEQQCRNYMQTRQLLPTTLTKLTFWLTFLLSNAPQQHPTKIYQVLLFLYPQTKLCTTSRRSQNSPYSALCNICPATNPPHIPCSRTLSWKNAHHSSPHLCPTSSTSRSQQASSLLCGSRQPWSFSTRTEVRQKIHLTTDLYHYLPALGKALDKIQSQRLLKHLVDQQLISPHQFGFIPGKSTTMQLLYLTEKWFRGTRAR